MTSEVFINKTANPHTYPRKPQDIVDNFLKQTLFVEFNALTFSTNAVKLYINKKKEGDYLDC